MQATELVIARLLDYFGHRTPWHRRLWNPGTVTLLKETLEAADLYNSNHLRKKAVEDLAKTAAYRAGPDLGVGPKSVKSSLTEILKEVRQRPGDRVVRHQLKYLLTRIEQNYLGRWSDILSENPTELPPEQSSRLLAGHLLGLGFSYENLHRWVTWVKAKRKPTTLADLFGEAEEVARRNKKPWSVLVPLKSINQHQQKMPKEWLDQAATTKWISENLGKAAPRKRTSGGFLLEICALDPWAAVELARNFLVSLKARVAVGKPTKPRLETWDRAFVFKSKKRFSRVLQVPLTHPERQVDVKSLKHHNAIFSIKHPGLTGRLRSAIDLLAPLETGAPGAAIAGGWAAVEAVLARPGTPNVQAAADLATLVACSFPRAELTPLVYAYRDTYDDALSQQLRDASSNRDRCALLGGAIERGGTFWFPNLSDLAAFERVKEITNNPSEVLKRVKGYAEESFRRLYRQRNLVLHAGKTDSVAMSSTLRTVPPLVGAGFDRLVHDALVIKKSKPLRLVARAQTELSLLREKEKDPKKEQRPQEGTRRP